MPDPADIPADVRSLIARHVDSVVQLELLLLLHGSPRDGWSAEDAARELRVEPAWTAAQLDRLAERGLLRRVAGNLYRADEGAAGVLARLATAYADRRVTIISMIYAKPADPLRTFADAFRLRRKDTNDG